MVVFSAVDGVEPQSETVWHQADKFHVPRVAFINKMDRIGAEWTQRGRADDQTRLGARPAPLQIPIGAEDTFRGVVDLVAMKAAHLQRRRGGRARGRARSTTALRAEAEAAREKLVETVADVDDALAEKYLGGEPIDEADADGGDAPRLRGAERSCRC